MVELIRKPRNIAIGATVIALAIGVFTFARLGAERSERLQVAAQESEAKRLQDSVAAARAFVGSKGVVPVDRPEHVRALYLNAWAAGSNKKLAKLIAIAD